MRVEFHVRSSGHPIFCVKRIASGPLTSHQISAQSVQPFPRYGKWVRKSALGSFIFVTELDFFQVFGANPVPRDVNNQTMSFFSRKTAFSVRAQEMEFLKCYGKSKTQFSVPLSCWGSKMFALMRGSQIWF